MTKKFQGDDVSFSIKLDNQSNPTVKDFTDVSNVIVYAYTDESYPQKFSLKTLADHSELLVISDTEVSGTITSEYTSNMSGYVSIEVMLEVSNNYGDKSTNIISKGRSSLFINESTIKESI